MDSSLFESDSSVFDVEEILDHRVARGKTEYYVKWLGFPISASTWEPPESFVSHEVIDEYKEKLRRKMIKHSEMNSFNFDDDFKTPEKVVNIFQDERGGLVCSVKFHDEYELQFVPAEIANERYPHLVISFYESRIYWKMGDKGQLIKHKFFESIEKADD